jgi:hypothetical protein
MMSIAIKLANAGRLNSLARLRDRVLDYRIETGAAMRRSIVSILSSAICFMAIAASPARAAQIGTIPANGAWVGGAYSDDHTHQFSHCAATASYRSGIFMTVSIGRDYGWILGFASDAWNFQTGQQIPLSMAFDGRSPWSGTARAINLHMAIVPMAINSDLINAFRGAYQMQIYAAGSTFFLISMAHRDSWWSCLNVSERN